MIYDDCPDHFGNPFLMKKESDRAKVVRDFRRYVSGLGSENMRKKIAHLRGRDLVCHCPIGKACHADVLLELANQ